MRHCPAGVHNGRLSDERQRATGPACQSGGRFEAPDHPAEWDVENLAQWTHRDEQVVLSCRVVATLWVVPMLYLSNCSRRHTRMRQTLALAVAVSRDCDFRAFHIALLGLPDW